MRTDARQPPLLLELIFRHMPELPEDGLLFSGMMVVSMQTSILREGHPVSVSHSACGPSSPDSGATGNESAGEADISSLLGMLAAVTDPRSPQGIQHALVFVLAVCVVAMLAGAKNYREIAGHAADMPQSLLRKLGAEWSWFRLRYPAKAVRLGLNSGPGCEVAGDGAAVAGHGGRGNGLALSDHVRAEQVKLDFPGDVGDAGLAGLAGGEVAGFLGLAGAGPVRPVADEGGGGEDLQQERGEREIGLLRGKKPRRCRSRRPGRAGS